MSVILVLADARSRGIELPSDDDAAQDILDETEAYLAGKIGALLGPRTETFYVGLSRTDGKLGLFRRTDSVALLDAGSVVNVDYYRLIDNGAAVVRSYASPFRAWTGPYVSATYEPSDALVVQSVLYNLLALRAEPISDKNSERLGDYSYSRGVSGGPTRASIEGALVSSILPTRDPATTLVAVSRKLAGVDSATVINMPEIEVFPT